MFFGVKNSNMKEGQAAFMQLYISSISFFTNFCNGSLAHPTFSRDVRRMHHSPYTELSAYVCATVDCVVCSLPTKHPKHPK